MVDFEFKDNYDINDLISIIALLRTPQGCPWDREQTHFSIKKNFIEETYEVIEAINKQNPDALKEELGDVLMQIALHCQMEAEAGSFNFNDVCNELCQKLIIRHPHVFGSTYAENTQQALESWDGVKQKTKAYKNDYERLVSVPVELPALMRAQKVQSRASKAGFDWDNKEGAFAKIEEEINELLNAVEHNCQPEIEDEFGDLLFSCVNASRFLKLDSEEALTKATNKFVARFKVTEEVAQQNGISMKTASIQELDMLWDKAKEILAETSAKTEEN